ncbi:unnamed protein product [Gadus morhua 'NCC']
MRTSLCHEVETLPRHKVETSLHHEAEMSLHEVETSLRNGVERAVCFLCLAPPSEVHFTPPFSYSRAPPLLSVLFLSSLFSFSPLICSLPLLTRPGVKPNMEVDHASRPWRLVCPPRGGGGGSTSSPSCPALLLPSDGCCTGGAGLGEAGWRKRRRPW